MSVKFKVYANVVITRLSVGAALNVAPRLSVCPSRASDFLETGKP